jgi:hypothetical protein
VFNHLSLRLLSAVVKDRELLVAEQANLADTSMSQKGQADRARADCKE